MRVVDINTLHALAPPSLRPRSQAVRPQPRTPQPRWRRRHSQYLSEGEADVIRPRGRDFEVVARVSLHQWRDLAPLPPAAEQSASRR